MLSAVFFNVNSIIYEIILHREVMLRDGSEASSKLGPKQAIKALNLKSRLARKRSKVSLQLILIYARS